MGFRKRRTDHNQGSIVKALEAAGYHVTDLSGVGKGCPDLLLTRNGLAYMVEIKNRAGRGMRFTDQQLLFFQQVKCPVYIIADLDDVELLIKGEKTPINR